MVDTPMFLDEGLMEPLPDAVNFAVWVTLVLFLVGNIARMRRNIKPANDSFIFDCSVYQMETRGSAGII